MPLFRGGMPGIFLILTADTVVASGAAIPYDTNEWSEQWPTWAAGSVTIPRSGTYLATARWVRQAQATAATTTVGLRLNGGDVLGSDRYPGVTAEVRGTLSALMRCVAGDVISVVGVQSSGGSPTYSANRNTLRVVRIGPEKWT